MPKKKIDIDEEGQEEELLIPFLPEDAEEIPEFSFTEEEVIPKKTKASVTVETVISPVAPTVEFVMDRKMFSVWNRNANSRRHFFYKSILFEPVNMVEAQISDCLSWCIEAVKRVYEIRTGRLVERDIGKLYVPQSLASHSLLSKLVRLDDENGYAVFRKS